MDTCCICLQDLKENDKIKDLSCNHKLHFECYMLYLGSKERKHFINCPLCRNLNTDVSIPGDTPKEKIQNLCQKSCRCLGITKSGLRCKNKSSLLNYGYCRSHNKEVLETDKQYDLMFRYINLNMYSPQSWKTRLVLVDIAKKLIIKFKIENIEDIMYYLFRSFEEQKQTYTLNEVIKNERFIYEYYELEPPPHEWIAKCLELKILY